MVSKMSFSAQSVNLKIVKSGFKLNMYTYVYTYVHIYI